MLNSRGFRCKVTWAANQEIKGSGACLWICAIQTAVKFRGYYGMKDKKTGEWRPYLNAWRDVHIWTDEIVDEGDELEVEEFTIVQEMQKRNEFDTPKWKQKIHILAFTNLTKRYTVTQQDRRKRVRDKVDRVVHSTKESLACKLIMADIERNKAIVMDDDKQKKKSLAIQNRAKLKAERLEKQAEQERLKQQAEKQRAIEEENEQLALEAERKRKAEERGGIIAFEVDNDEN